MLHLSLGVMGQTMTKTKVLKSTDLGNQKLEAVISQGDTTMVLIIKTGSRVMPTVNAVLGGRDDALRILNFLLEAEPSGDDVIDLENPSHNYVKKNPLGGLAVFSTGQQFSGQLRKPNIKGFIKAVREFYGMKD